MLHYFKQPFFCVQMLKNAQTSELSPRSSILNLPWESSQCQPLLLHARLGGNQVPNVICWVSLLRIILTNLKKKLKLDRIFLMTRSTERLYFQITFCAEFKLRLCYFCTDGIYVHNERCRNPLLKNKYILHIFYCGIKSLYRFM